MAASTGCEAEPSRGDAMRVRDAAGLGNLGAPPAFPISFLRAPRKDG
jgi:hypothetical protein